MKEVPDRRRFIQVLLSGSGVAWLASVLYPVIRYLTPLKEMIEEASTVRAADLSTFPVNTGKIIKFGNKPVLLIRRADGSFKAHSGKCTHLDCIVQYRPDMERIWCACHNGQYDLNGNTVAGPPPRPLEQFEVLVKGEEIFVTRKA